MPDAAERSFPAESAASWREAAEKITVDTGLRLGEVAERTGLTATTIMNVVLRRTALARRAVMAPLARPAFDFNGEPRWRDEQVADYFDTLEAHNRPLAETYKDLRRVDRAGADAENLVGLRSISERTGVHLTSVHRWRQREDWPAPAAIIPADSPTAYLVWEWATIRAWLLAHKAELPALRGVDVAGLPA